MLKFRECWISASFFHFGEDIGIKHLHAVTVYGNFLTMNGNGKTGAADHMGEKLRNGCLAMSEAAKADCKYPLRNKKTGAGMK